MGDHAPYTCVRWAFHFLLYERDDQVHVHCLDTDTVATGNTTEEAAENLQDSLSLRIDNCKERDALDQLWRRAPEELWDKASQAWSASLVDILDSLRPTPKTEKSLEETARKLYELSVE